MKRPSVECVIVNWKRKNNIPLIVEAMRSQSVPCTVTVIDNASDDIDAVDEGVSRSVEKYFRIKEHPYGPFIRFMCGNFYGSNYLYFCDDDLAPGPRCLEHFLNHVETDNSIGVLGQLGRIITGNKYLIKDAPRGRQTFTEIDICIRAYFVKSLVLTNIKDISEQIFLKRKNDLFWHDDMLLSAACRIAKKNLAVTPLEEELETIINYKELPSPHALSANPGRSEARTTAWRDVLTIFGEKMYPRRQE